MFEPVALSGTFTFPMAEDDMEISSEHGHNGGDEDIDIDIDLTAGHVDEDYILEDATSTADFGADFQQPAIGQDDLMLDDDNNSYQMDDADLLQHEGAQAVEIESMSFATSAAAISPEYHTSTSNLMSNGMHENTVVENEQLHISEYTELQGGPHAVDDQEAAQLQDQHAIQAQETIKKGDEQYSQATEVSADIIPKSAPVSPLREEHHVTTPTKDHDGKASPHSAQESVEGPVHAPEHTDDNLENLSFAENHAGDIPAVSEQEELSSTVPDIFVTYRSIQYTLFSSSEIEDPDTYFLSDPSIMEKPMPDFFQAIREVIHEDLSDEDELRLSVSSLGLEAQEASTSIQEVTLSQVLNLHEILLRNVEEDSPEPLHLTLDVKPNFQRRFSKLVAGASEGKGLAEILPWECIESAIDSGEEDEHQEDLESGEQREEGESKNEAQNGEDQTAHQSPSLLDADNFQESAPWTPGDSLLNDFSAPATAGSEVPKSEKIIDSSVDEDGDLIDYSEDELEIEKERKQPGVPKTANNKIDNEYEKINEDLLKRSLSRDEQEILEQTKDAQEAYSVQENTLDEWQQNSHDSVDHKDEKQHRSEESVTGDEGQSEESPDKWQQSPGALGEPAVNDGNEEEQAEEEEEGGDGYEDYTENKPEENVNTEYREFDVADSGEEGNHDYSTALGQDFTESTVNYEFGAGEAEYADQDDFNGSFVSGVADEDVNELNISLETEEQAGSTNSTDAPNQSGEVDLSDHIDNSALGSLALVDTAESSVTLSADEIQYEDRLDEEVFDESAKADDTRLWTEDAKSDLNIEQKDEIDYEDDEEEEKSESVSIPLAQPSQGVAEGSPVNAKRSRAELDFEDAWNDNGNIAKRRRS